MGFLNNIFSSFARNTYKGICKTMINSYYKVKEQNPNVSSRELYALALSLRPTWKRDNPSSYDFIKGNHTLTIEKDDTFEDVVRNLIIIETAPPGIGANQDFVMEVIASVQEGFKDFEE